MGIKLPQYTIEEYKKQPSFLLKMVTPIFVIVSFFAGYFINAYLSEHSVSTLSERNITLEENISKKDDKITQLETQIQHLITEQQVKQEALIKLQMDYKAAINEHNSLKSDINFYERLLSPNEENKGLRVFESSITAISQDSYRYKLTLVQKLERANIVSGKVEIMLNGTKDGKSESINVTENQDSGFSFKYFNHLNFTISLPSGFNAQELVVKLFPQKSKTVEYKVDWNTLINSGAK